MSSGNAYPNKRPRREELPGYNAAAPGDFGTYGGQSYSTSYGHSATIPLGFNDSWRALNTEVNQHQEDAWNGVFGPRPGLTPNEQPGTGYCLDVDISTQLPHAWQSDQHVARGNDSRAYSSIEHPHQTSSSCTWETPQAQTDLADAYGHHDYSILRGASQVNYLSQMNPPTLPISVAAGFRVPASTFSNPPFFFPDASFPQATLPGPTLSAPSLPAPEFQSQAVSYQSAPISFSSFPTSTARVFPGNSQETPTFVGPREITEDTQGRNNVNALEPEVEIICFGMFVHIPGTCNLSSLTEASSHPVKLQSSGSFVGAHDSNFQGEIGSDSKYLTEALLEEPSLELQAVCFATEHPSKTTSNGKRLRVSKPASKCHLNIILYGPSDLADDISIFIDKCNEELEDQPKLYLQDPVGCNRNVPYCNPQRLPPLDPMFRQLTLEITQKRPTLVELDAIEPLPELLELLDSQEDLPETMQPQAIATALKGHQKQALTFMLRREQGWVFDGTRPDIWEGIETENGISFTNRVSGARQADEPPVFYGGIIADPMGFGKTLAMITLIASDAETAALNDAPSVSGVLGEECSGLTLVVVPPALLGTWEEEFRNHTEPHRLPWRLYHGKLRQKGPTSLEDTMIVLTTYHTVSTEWRSVGSREPSILFTTRWRRVILDEAHFIRNSESQMARAVCNLDSVSRWAVTGTPIQNHLNDLATLLKFLGVYPYNDKRIFDADISQMWKTGRADEAVKRLKRLAGCLLLRRPRKTVELPPRHDRACLVDLQPEERALYDQVRMQTIARLDEALLQGSNANSAGVESFVSVLQQIEAMRMVCNLGLLYPNRHDTSTLTAKGLDAEEWHQAAQSGFNVRFEVGSIHCHSCAFILDAAYNPFDDTDATKALFSRCLRFFCPSCVRRDGQKIIGLGCGHTPPCPIASVSTSAASLEALPTSISVGNSGYLPSKVTALVEDLQTLAGDVKSVVFSTWRMTLDVVEAGFQKAGIVCLRFDGKVPQKERQKVIQRFRNDSSIRVLLLTLSCGAVGLTLTAASRAYLMEPHWNPTLEDQALARIHRMGQEKPVATLRFYIRDSFEEVVVKNQKFKRELANILLAPNDTSTNSSGHLERLRMLI